MRKGAEVALAAGVFVGATFLYYYQQNGDTDVQSYADWMQSVLRGLFVKAKATAENATGTGNYMDIATSLVADFETFSSKVYPDAGHLALGYGHDIVPGDGFDANSTISEADAYALLQGDLSTFDACISNNVTVQLSDNQRAALLSLVYNIGCGNFASSTLLSLLNSGDYDGAAEQFLVWNKSRDASGALVVNQALVNRRASEMGQFQS